MAIDVIDRLQPKGGKFKVLVAKDIDITDDHAVDDGIILSYNRLCGSSLNTDPYSLEQTMKNIFQIFQDMPMRSGSGDRSVILNASKGQTPGVDDCQASGDRSVAEGQGTQATKTASHAEGQNTIADGIAAHAEGTSYDGVFTTAANKGAHAEGQGTKAIGEGTHSEGRHTQAIGDTSHAEGKESIAQSASAHAEGVRTDAKGEGAHTEGYGSKTHAQAAHAEGANTIAYSKFSHTEGQGTQVGQENNSESAIAAHAEGYYSKSTAKYAHAEGEQTEAAGQGSHVEGYHTQSTVAYQHVQGKFNKTPDMREGKNAVHIVGWGNSNADRSNIHVLYEDGHAYYSGTINSPTIRRIDSAANSLNNKVDALIDTHNTHVNEISMLISQNNEDISKLKSSLTRFDRFAEFSEGLKYGGAFDELPTITVDVESGAIKISGTLTTLQGSVDTDINNTESLDDDNVEITNTVTATKELPNEIIPVVNPGLVIVVKGVEYILEQTGDEDNLSYQFIKLMNISDAFYNVEDEIDRYHPMELKSASHSGSGIVLVGTPDVVVESTITVNKKCQHTTVGAGFDLSGLDIDSHSEGYEEIIVDDLQTKKSDSNFVKIQEILSTTTNTTTYKTRTIFHSSSVTGIFQDSLYGGSEYSTEPASISCLTKQVTIALKDRPGNTASTTISVTPVYPIYVGIFTLGDIAGNLGDIAGKTYPTFEGLGNMKLQTSLNISSRLNLSGQLTPDAYSNGVSKSDYTYLFYGIPKSIMRGKTNISMEWIAGMTEDISIQFDNDGNPQGDQLYEVEIANVPYIFARCQQVIVTKTKSVQSITIS